MTQPPPQPLTEERVAELRAETPGVEHVIHFNNAGSSLPPKVVVDTHTEYLALEARIGGYEAVEQEAAALQLVYDAGADLLNCGPDELAFTTGAAQAWWRSFEVVPLEAGDRVLISDSEYQANVFGFVQAAERGVDIAMIPATESGEIDLEALRGMMDERVKLVAVTQVGMANGMVQPAVEVGSIVADTDALYLLDSCQAVGQMPVDVQELQCDFLSFTGRKFMRGPRGTGLLYVRSGVMDQLDDPTYLDGRSAQWQSAHSYKLDPTALRYELGEVSFGAKAGFGAALAYAVDVGMDAAAHRISMLATSLREGLQAIEGVDVADRGLRQSGIVTVTIDGVDPVDLQAALRAQTINTSVISAALSRFDLDGRGIAAVLRAGVHYFNTNDEVAALIRAVQKYRADSGP